MRPWERGEPPSRSTTATAVLVRLKVWSFCCTDMEVITTDRAVKITR